MRLVGGASCLVDSVASEPAAGLGRRGLLTGAGGIAAVGALAGLPVATSARAAKFSPEFLEFRRLVAVGQWPEWSFSPRPPTRTEAEYAAALERWMMLLCRKIDIERAILARPPDSWAQAVELAALAQRGNRAAKDALVNAVVLASKGGTNV